jgi:hypothetical protein
MTKTHPIQRATLSKDLVSLQDTFVKGIYPILEALPGWYGSIYFERKSSKTFSANLKQTQLADQVNSGVVLRIYDGYTLFEQATDELEPESLKRLATEFVQRVKNTPSPAGAQHRPYTPPNWKDRLQIPGLDTEITSQIPKNVSARTPVHFGIRFEQDPTTVSAAATLDNLKALVEQCRKMAPTVGRGRGIHFHRS